MCRKLKLQGTKGILTRFWNDRSGGVPIEVIALTGSLVLLGVTVMETQDTGMPVEGTEMSEEVFVRKCGQLVTGSELPAMPDVGANNACR